MLRQQRPLLSMSIRVVLMLSALAGVLWTIHALQQPGALTSALTPIVATPGPGASAEKAPLTTSGENK